VAGNGKSLYFDREKIVVSSFEIIPHQAVFSFQIAHHSSQLQSSTTAEWADISLDSLADIVLAMVGATAAIGR
jgi:hypothetical protein